MKNQEGTPWGKTLENLEVLSIISTTLTKTGGEWQVALFDSKSKYVSVKLEHKLQAVSPVLCWYFFNLNEKTVVKKRKNCLFLIAKMYISFYQ